MFFVQKATVPFETKKVICSTIVCYIRTLLTVGGNLLDYTGPLITSTVTITTVKCLFNSVVSTLEAKCVTADIKNFYSNNDLPDLEYMKIHMTMIPNKICKEYNIKISLIARDGCTSKFAKVCTY